jgi:hypothetical protein
MANLLRLALWNANGLIQHAEVKTFISVHNIDVMLISETHFTEKVTSNYSTIQSTTPIIQPELLKLHTTSSIERLLL